MSSTTDSSARASNDSTMLTALPGYQIIRAIGSGQYGMVFLALDPEGNQVAVKAIANVLKTTKHTISAVRELTILRQLSAMAHAKNHITPLRTAALAKEADGTTTLFLVMDYFPSQLNAFLEESEIGDINDAGVIKLVYSLLCSLNFIHSADIVHRDVKPANFMMSEDGGLHLGDFGFGRTLEGRHLKNPVDKKQIAKDLKSSRRERHALKRSLSPHVVTRWYRPPEIILMDKEYNNSADLWSGACVVSEIITCSSTYQKLGFKKKKRQLFRGKACFPLSPAKDEKASDQDQLKLILNILGKQNSRDKSYLTNHSQDDYLTEVESNEEKVDFDLEFSKSDPRLTKILTHLLNFNPHFRVPAGSLLKSSLFDAIRKPDLEKPASHFVVDPVTNDSDSSFLESLLEEEVRLAK